MNSDKDVQGAARTSGIYGASGTSGAFGLILEAELKAETVKKEALAKSSRIIASAQKEAEIIKEKERAETKRQITEIIAQAEKTALSEVASEESVVTMEIEALNILAKDKMNQAVNFVIERIFRTDGNN